MFTENEILSKPGIRGAGMRTKSPTSAPGNRSVITTLVVDDDPAMRSVLERFLTGLGHETVAVADGREALTEASRRKLTCILLDVCLPDASGVHLVETLLDREPDAAVIMLSGTADPEAAASAMHAARGDGLRQQADGPGASGRAIKRALVKAARTEIEQAETQEWLRRENVRQDVELRRETREHGTASPSRRSKRWSMHLKRRMPICAATPPGSLTSPAMIAAELGMTDEQVEIVRVAGRGCTTSARSAFGKRGACGKPPDPLSPEEFDHVKTHVVIGAQILAPLAHLREVIGYVRSASRTRRRHGLSRSALPARAIPVGARIIGATEVFDALTTARPYQDKMAPEEAVARMRDLIPARSIISEDVHRRIVGRRFAARTR